jgi:regulator of PEP synthase PpsR (kinase-PPPase family)
MPRRTAFFVSDQTGVTAETLGHSLLTQFEGLDFKQVTLPFISSTDKAEEAVRRINANMNCR